MNKIGACLSLNSALRAANLTQAALITPTSDAEVVQALPYLTSLDTRSKQARIPGWHRGGTPSRPQALAAAPCAIDRSCRHGDPREPGLAQAALAPGGHRPRHPRNPACCAPFAP